MGLSKERRANLKLAGGWGVLIGVILLTAVCCAPMTYLRTPPAGRGAYIPLTTARLGGGGIALSQCSWGRVDKDTIVTAKHCVGDSQGWLLPEMPSAPAICVDTERDSAYLVIASPAAPKSRVELPAGAPKEGDLVCYDSFYGRHNCGRVTRVFSDRFVMDLQQPVRAGDSGSPIYTYNATVGVVSRRVDGQPLGLGATLPKACEK